MIYLRKLAWCTMCTFVILMVGCGPKKPMISQQQISDARNNGSLEVLYKTVQVDLKEASGSHKEKLTALSTQIAQQIASDKQQAITQAIEDSRLPQNVAPLNVLNELKEQAKEIAPFDSGFYESTKRKLLEESTQSQDALTKQLLVVGKIPVDDAVQRINAMSVAAQIAGKGSQHFDNYSRLREQTLVGWLVDADTAMSKRQYTLAATYLRKVIGLDPNNAEAKEKLTLSEQQGFESAFRKALENRKPELAFNELQRIAESPLFENIKSSLSSSIKLLSDFFINRGLQSSSQGALKGAFQHFVKARKIRSIMGQEPQQEAEVDYLKKLVNLAAVRGQAKRFGEQLAYLEIVNEFNPAYPNVKSLLTEARKNIIKYSSTSMIIDDFAQTGTHHSAGKAVSQKVYSWVFDSMPGEIALISTEQFSSMDENAPGKVIRLSGDILQAGVDSENIPSQKTMRVVTETTKTPNPEYAKWKKRGSNGDSPEEFIVTEKKEDVSVNVTYHKKTGILSVSYRLNDQRSGQVIVNQNARDKQLFEGESNEGINIGEFKLDYKRAELPSDIEILEALSTKVAEIIGEKLRSMFKNPDERYEALANKSLEQKQFEPAKNYLGFATAIRHAKGGDITEIRARLIEVVMRH